MHGTETDMVKERQRGANSRKRDSEADVKEVKER